MKTFYYTLILTLVVALMTAAGCATKRQTGAVAGGAAGAAAGAAVGDRTGAVVGGLLGALLGSEVGRHMDENDRRETSYALEQNKVGETKVWTDPDTGDRYAVTPTNTYNKGNSPCRDFIITREANGRQYESRETACRQSDGTWKVIG